MNEEYRWFITLIPNGHKFVCNEYVHGRVNAILRLCCSAHKIIHMGTLKRYSQPNESFGFFFEVWTTEELYEGAKRVIDKWYPGMCEFDIPYEEDFASFDEDYDDEYERGVREFVESLDKEKE